MTAPHNSQPGNASGFDPYTMKPITIAEHKIVFETDLEPEAPLLDFDEWMAADAAAEKDKKCST